MFVRKDIEEVLDLFRQKGYACGYLTTNGTAITESRARRRWPTWRSPASSSTSACRLTARENCTTRHEA